MTELPEQCNERLCYGAYSSAGGIAPIPLRSWAEQACAPRKGL